MKEKLGCPYRRDEKHSCRGSYIGSGVAATSICNFGERSYTGCNRFYREAALADIKPETFCCPEMENLFHDCAESDGYMAGGFDLRIYPNDGKDVWRNYQRVKFRVCPFCGTRLIPETEKP